MEDKRRAKRDRRRNLDEQRQSRGMLEREGNRRIGQSDRRQKPRRKTDSTYREEED